MNLPFQKPRPHKRILHRLNDGWHSRYLGPQKILILFILALQGCQTLIDQGLSSYDDNAIQVQVLNLFNQRQRSDGGFPWKGDWIFRRERLGHLDNLLRNSKPDLIYFFEMMQKTDSPFDADQIILSAGALQNYLWNTQTFLYHQDTDEIEQLAIAVGPTMQPEEAKQFPDAEDLAIPTEAAPIWQGARQWHDGHALYTVLISLPMQESFLKQLTTLDQALTEIYLAAEAMNVCKERVLLSLRTTVPVRHLELESLLQRFGLVDSSTGFCKNASLCFTATTQNELFYKAIGDIAPEQSLRLLLSDRAIVYDAKRNFTETKPLNPFMKPFQLNSLPISTEYGWSVNTRIPKCKS